MTGSTLYAMSDESYRYGNCDSDFLNVLLSLPSLFKLFLLTRFTIPQPEYISIVGFCVKELMFTNVATVIITVS